MTETAAPRPEDLPPPVLLRTSEELARRCRDWRRAEAIAVDTEFVRERTFYPGLGLVQVTAGTGVVGDGVDGGEIVLVDPLAIDDLDPLGELLTSPDVVKVFHSASEDLEVLYHAFGTFPSPLFDTQVAATLCGVQPPPGYGSLVERLFGIVLPKGQTRTNWLKRPLTDAQIRYAGLDVAYLLPARDVLARRLEELGRGAWLAEELAPLADPDRFLPDLETVHLGLRGAHRLDRRRLAVLQALASWRERTARKRDLPRNFVVPEAALLEVARALPRSRNDLAGLSKLRRGDVERHGRTLLRLVREVLEKGESEIPPRLPRPVDIAKRKDDVRRLRDLVARRAEELDVAPELLANRRTVEELVRRHVAGEDPVLPAALRGWREAVIGTELARELS